MLNTKELESALIEAEKAGRQFSPEACNARGTLAAALNPPRGKSLPTQNEIDRAAWNLRAIL